MPHLLGNRHISDAQEEVLNEHRKLPKLCGILQIKHKNGPKIIVKRLEKLKCFNTSDTFHNYCKGTLFWKLTERPLDSDVGGGIIFL